MTLGEVILLLVMVVVAMQFWRIRSISEQANQQIARYCQTHNLQLLAVARKQTRLSFRYGKLDWFSVFIFEFSGNGEDKYTGEVQMIGRNVINTELPPYRVS